MARKDIRRRMKREYEAQGRYEAVAASWDLTGGMVWRIINEKGYWPADEEIRRRINAAAREKGVPVGRRGRKRDLFSMDPTELLWRLQNREVVT